MSSDTPLSFSPLAAPITDKDSIRVLIPQKDPVCMLDQLLRADTEITRTRLDIREDNFFFENGKLSESGIIENMAQTIAIRVGYYYDSINKTAPKGFIGAVRNMKIKRLPKLGESIECQIKVEQEIFGVTMVSGQTFIGDEIIASGTMKTVLEKTQSD